MQRVYEGKLHFLLSHNDCSSEVNMTRFSWKLHTPNSKQSVVLRVNVNMYVCVRISKYILGLGTLTCYYRDNVN